jgi:hypothetical protein
VDALAVAHVSQVQAADNVRTDGLNLHQHTNTCFRIPTSRCVENSCTAACIESLQIGCCCQPWWEAASAPRLLPCVLQETLLSCSTNSKQWWC